MSASTLPRPPAPPPPPGSRRDLAGRPGRTPSHRGGRPEDPSWARPSLLLLLAGTALLYLGNLGASGTGNIYYAAAVRAGTQSWKAFLFGSLDAGNAITVDKPPASLWVMELSGRIFGVNDWSLLAPQALEGIAAVALLHAAVRRVSGPAAGLLAGTALALTPVAALMFRFNNPDALLVLLMVAAAYCTVRALEAAAARAGTGWLVLAGVCLGFGFLTKMLQAFLVLPALAIAYLLFADGRLVRRIGRLLAAGAALVGSAGWWIALVELWPASSRPYIGGSTTNSALQLALGYNGLSRIVGNGGGPGGGGAPGGGPGGGMGGNTGFGGAAGLLRMFGNSFGTEISWLLPAALIALAGLLWTTRRAPRTDLTRASTVLWGLWLVVTGLVLSLMSGIVHPYYAVALAPAIAALVGTGAAELWRRRDDVVARGLLALLVAATGIWSIVLLGRTPTWYPAIRYALVPLTVVAVVVLLLTTTRARARAAGLTVAVALVTGLGATGAYAVQTAALPHGGSIPISGPSASGQGGFDAGPGGMPGGMPGGGPGGTGGSTDAALVALLQRSTTRWAAATSGAQSAAGLELASGASVMGIGGFTGSDPAPTLAQFQADVKAGLIHYYVLPGGGPGGGPGSGPGGGPGGMGGGPDGSGTSGAIQTWVTAHYRATTVGGATVYDLTSPTS